ncbi:hypothetical protein D9757_008607 [Collybiopsis confluens]|uniref:Uncharacterized protein n=1 Tax=Collybiopsis confluens TaxID=2823264 RepID=A0A8H5HMX8_9AGAR|nr:hypothetical protein D9757_008607 [Collybiopsis confluens]
MPFVSGNALGEVKALKMKGQLVAAGELEDGAMGSRPMPVIVMIKQPGHMLYEVNEYNTASPGEQLEMRKQAIKLMCQEVAEDAVTKHL